MKYNFIYCLPILLLLSVSIFATQQEGDIVTYEGNTYFSEFIPIDPEIIKNTNFAVDVETNSDGLQVSLQRSSNYRGFNATWEIINKTLFLKNITGYCKKSDDKEGLYKIVSLEALFPKRFKDGLVQADWFSGNLRIEISSFNKIKKLKDFKYIVFSIEKSKILAEKTTFTSRSNLLRNTPLEAAP